MKVLEFTIDDIITSCFLKTRAKIIEITENYVIVKYCCNGKTRKFFKSLFITHNVKKEN